MRQRGFPVPPTKDCSIRQIAALPYRFVNQPSAGIELLLVTSRDTGRWVLPKGNLMAPLAPHRAAAHEAEEEAGVRGSVAKKPIGTYHYAKWRNEDAYDVAEVTVYALLVVDELSRWKEQRQRERRWVSRAEAAEMVEEPELRALIALFSPATS